MFHAPRLKKILQMAIRVFAPPTRSAPRRLRPCLELLEDRLTPSASVQYSLLSDWGSGFQGQVTITDTQSTALDWQKLDFDLARPITQIWNAQIVSHVGSHYVVAPAAWDSHVNGDSSISFGFLGGPGSQPPQLANAVLTYTGGGNRRPCPPAR